MHSPPTEQSKFPLGLTVFGWSVLFVMAPLSLRLMYEQTVLTWRDGWQMVGFSLAHVIPGLLIIGIVGAICAHVYLVVLLVLTALNRLRGRPLLHPNLLLVFGLVAMTGVLYVPYAGWITLLVTIRGPGQHGNSYLNFAAAEHHLHLVKTLVDSGVPVDAPYDGDTALNAACVVKDVQIARYLLSKGADLNRAPACAWVYEINGKPRPIEVPKGSTVE